MGFSLFSATDKWLRSNYPPTQNILSQISFWQWNSNRRRSIELSLDDSKDKCSVSSNTIIWTISLMQIIIQKVDNMGEQIMTFMFYICSTNISYNKSFLIFTRLFAVFQSLDFWQIARKPLEVNLTPNTIDVSKIHTAFPKRICVETLHAHSWPQIQSHPMVTQELRWISTAGGSQRGTFLTHRANANKRLLAAHPEWMNNLRKTIRPTVFWCFF